MGGPIVGTPDWQRGIVNAGKVLATVPQGTLTTTVEVPPNTQTLVIAFKNATNITSAQVLGNTTGIQYPGTFRTYLYALGDSNLYLFTVLPALDPSITVTLGSDPGCEWYVYSMANSQTVDVAELSAMSQYNANASYDMALAISGWDGAAYEALLTDTAGHLLTYDQTLKLAVAARGVAAPSDAVLVAGTDGTDLYALSADSSGRLATNDEWLAQVQDVPGQSLNGRGLQVGGSDGTDFRLFQTDSNGRAIPLVPTASVVALMPSGYATILGPPTSGHWYLFGVDLYATTAVQTNVLIYPDNIGGNYAYLQVTLPANGDTVTVDLHGYMANNGGNVRSGASASYNVVLRYAPGP